MKILIVCGAGASSTFVALRVRRTAAERGIPVEVAAGSESDLPDGLGGVTVLLVGPHLEHRFDQIRDQAGDRGVAARLMPDTVFAARDGEQALDLALGAQAARS